MGLRIPPGRTLAFFYFENDISQSDFAPKRHDILNGKRHFNRPAVLALVALTTIWGYNWVVMKECLSLIGYIQNRQIRSVIGSDLSMGENTNEVSGKRKTSNS